MEEKLELIAIQTDPYNDDLYVLVDFLNRTLKQINLIFWCLPTQRRYDRQHYIRGNSHGHC